MHTKASAMTIKPHSLYRLAQRAPEQLEPVLRRAAIRMVRLRLQGWGWRMLCGATATPSPGANVWRAYTRRLVRPVVR